MGNDTSFFAAVTFDKIIFIITSSVSGRENDCGGNKLGAQDLCSEKALVLREVGCPIMTVETMARIALGLSSVGSSVEYPPPHCTMVSGCTFRLQFAPFTCTGCTVLQGGGCVAASVGCRNEKNWQLPVGTYGDVPFCL